MSDSLVRFRKNSHSPYRKKKNFDHIKKYVIIFFLLIIVTLITVFVLQKTLRHPDRYIRSIIYTESSRSFVADPEFYDYLTSQLYNKNIYNVRYVSSYSLVEDIRNIYPFLQDISIVSFLQWQAVIDVSFVSPELLIANSSQRWWVYDNYLHPIMTGDLLGTWSYTLYLGSYLNDVTDLEWLFFVVDSSVLVPSIYAIQESIPDLSRIEYLAGGNKLVVTHGNRVLYFNLLGDISHQLFTYDQLWSYYTGTTNVRTFDLWSLEHTIIEPF